MAQKKIIIITTPSSSRIYPILPIIENLVTHFNTKVIVYSCVNYKTEIENTGAEFRTYFSKLSTTTETTVKKVVTVAKRDTDTQAEKQNIVLKLTRHASKLPMFITQMVDIAEHNTLYLAKEIYNEKPQLVLFEKTALQAKLVLRLLIENYKLVTQSDEEPELPPTLYFSTKFVTEKNVFPVDEALGINDELIVDIIKTAVDTEILKMRIMDLCEELGLKYIDPFEETFYSNTNVTNVVFVLPELHPKVYLYHRNNKFIGTVINEKVAENAFNSYNVAVKCILREFQPRQSPSKHKSDRALIMIYLKNKYKENKDICWNLLKVFNNCQLTEYQVLFSFSQKGMLEFQKQLIDNEIFLKPNITISTECPKLEILKRASLLITNADMHSVNESLYFGVPMLCMPISSAQMLISHRITTELGLGKFIEINKLESSEILSAIDSLISDSYFKNNCVEFSRFFREYDVTNNATKIILDAIEEEKPMSD